MRWIVLGASLAFFGSALAQDNDAEPTQGRLIKVYGPTVKDDAKYFPNGAPVSGSVALQCVLTAQGTPTDCTLAKEDPANSGLVAVAMEEVKLFKFKPLDADGKSVAGRRVVLHQNYLAAGDKNPSWLRRPSNEELTSAMPVKAMKERKDGSALISCRITVEGFLDRCSVVAETPEGLGYGAAALHLSKIFAMNPKIRGGVAVEGGEVRIPISWKGLSGSGPATVSRERIVADPNWFRTPTLAAVRAAYPQKAAGVPDGQAVVRCQFDQEGNTRSCSVISETPRSLGFGAAARTLADGGFAVQVGPEGAKVLSTTSVDIPFRFRNPSAPDNGRLTEPRWIQTLSAKGAAILYPKAARDAGLSTGVGYVDCSAMPDGGLGDCRITKEEPVEKGFGAAALEAAKVMKTNPWTRTGDPAEGRRILLPIRFKLEDPAPPAAAAPKP